MIEVDNKHPLVKQLKSKLRDRFIHPPKDMALNLIKKYNTIKNDIILSEILNEKEIEQFIKYNRKRIDSLNLLIPTLNSTIKRLNGFGFEKESSREYCYKNVKEVEEDIILFDEDNIFDDVLLNLFYNRDVEFKFNHDIPLTEVRSHSRVQTCRLNIINMGSTYALPIKYNIVCTASTDFGIECGNVVEFCDVHKHSAIKCTDTTTTSNKGHTIKAVDKVKPVDNKMLYRYYGSDESNEDSKEFMVYSFVKLSDNIATCNCIFINDDNQKKIYVLAVKEEKIQDDLEEPILLKNPKNACFLEDIFQSLKKYYKKYHNFILTDQNKMVAKVYIFQCLMNKMFNRRFHSFVMGKSGSGKSIYSKMIFPMFTFDFQVVSGTGVTANRFLGGQDINKNFLPGYAVTQDLVALEECSSALNYYLDPNNQRFNSNNSNLFHMMKLACGDTYNTSQQASQTVNPKASFFLVGNLEHLKLLTEGYKKLVARHYKKFSSGKNYDFSLPIFKSIDYYKETLDNDNLAKAHAYVRLNNYRDSFFMTGLPEAEQARFIFNIILENDIFRRGIVEMPHNMNNKEDKYKRFNVHRTDFMEELGIFKHFKYNKKLFNQIRKFFYEEYLLGRNNFNKIKGEDMNSHIKVALFEVIYFYIICNKIYWDEELGLKEEDKSKVRHFLRFNYNSLTEEESCEKIKPAINDYNSYDVNELESLNVLKNEEYVAKLKEEGEKLKELVITDDFEDMDVI